ncbi:hypothetical protein ABT160_02045 [Streptomyces sp. NPDC001941]|uniref:hypothetical protein n=1 Tax=Streptomyces sp. NPDC001941 TaxID=3154659 RepID=UPI003317C64D
MIPERPSLLSEAALFVGRVLWGARRALVPTVLAVLALVLAAVLHTSAPWAGVPLGLLAAGPAAWLLLMQRARPGRATVLAWRIALATLATVAGAWLALAVVFGPLAGPLEVVWLLLWIVAQTAWLIVRRTH